MEDMYFYYFTDNKEFPFFIQHGSHINDMYCHRHKDFTEMVLVLNGQAEHIVDNEHFNIEKGDCFIIGNDTVHGYRSTSDFKIMNIMFRPDFFFHPEDDIKKSAGFHALFVLEPYFLKEHTFTQRLKLSKKDFITISNLAESILHEYNSNSECRQTMLTSQFLSLSVQLARIYSDCEKSSNMDVINIATAVSYMETHFTENISVESLAGLSNYSTRHFTRIFTAAYGSSPINYIHTLRLTKACSLLRETKLSITEIALLCGFNDINYFSRFFRKRMELSPFEFRRQM